MSDYNAYIIQERNLFQQSYISTCSAANPNLNLYAPQRLYHYTLYYYDQADNLIRTVPPEGVHLLPSSQWAAVDASRNQSAPGL